MSRAPDFGPLRAVLKDMPPPAAPATTGDPYLRQEAENEWVIQGPHYLPFIDELWAAFRAAGFPEIGQVHYISYLDEWVRQHPPSNPEWDLPEPAQVAMMSREDCFNLLRYIERGERFGDGLWSAAHGIGWFHAIAERLIELGEART